MSISIPNEIWTPGHVLYEAAAKLCYYYLDFASFMEKDQVKGYREEIENWNLWLEIASELLSRTIEPREFMSRHVYLDAQIPLPSKLLTQRRIDVYDKWLLEEAGGGEAIDSFQRTFLQIRDCCDRTIFDKDEIKTDQLNQELLKFQSGMREEQYPDPRYDRNTGLAEYVYVHWKGIADQAVHGSMFCEAVLRFYSLRQIWLNPELFPQFMSHFEPVARKNYLLLTDFSKVDFTEVKERLERDYDPSGPILITRDKTVDGEA